MANESLDELVELAWRRFRGVLADKLDQHAEQAEAAGTNAGPVFIGIDVDPGFSGDLVWIFPSGGHYIVNVLDGSALPSGMRPSRQGLARVRALGWARPTRGTRRYEALKSHARLDELVFEITAVLRETFGVLHPAFLVVEGLCEPAETVPREHVEPSPALGVVLPRPRTSDELIGLASAAIASVTGSEPQRDDDGDIAIGTNDGVVFLHVLPDSMIVRLFADVVLGVADASAAAAAVAELNAQVGGVTFVHEGEAITVTCDVVALPFVAEHLLAQIARMCAIVDAHSQALAQRVNGATFVGHAGSTTSATASVPEPAGIPAVMLQLLQLDAGPDDLTSQDVAEICGHDANLIVELIWWNEEQVIEWRTARDEADAAGDLDEAETSESECAAAQRFVSLLRRALRRTLLHR